MNKRLIACLIPLCLLWNGCEKMLMDQDTGNDAVSTFDYLWERIDQQYSLFDVKNVDWAEAYELFRPQIYQGMTSDSLFRVMRRMLNMLNDGHVNIYTSFDLTHCDSILYRKFGRKNIDESVVFLNYLTTSYHTTGGLKHKLLPDNVIYIKYESFSDPVGSSQMEYIINRYPNAKGMILDLRQNGGGSLSNVWNILNAFSNNGQTLYYSQIKNGPAHDDFTPLTPVRAKDLEGGYTKPVAILIDRGSYSATSMFALCTQAYDNLFLVGDTTGGGLGIPNGGQLPNGWRYRFSVGRNIALDNNNYENGMPPDYPVRLSPTATAANRDNVIDTAILIISNYNL